MQLSSVWNVGRRYMRIAANAALARCAPPIVSLDRPVFIWGPPQSGTFLLYDLVDAMGGFACHRVMGPRKKGLARSPAAAIVFARGAPQEGLLRFWSGVGVDFEQRDGGWRFAEPLSAAQCGRINFSVVRQRYRHAEVSLRRQRLLTVLDKCPYYLLMISAIDRAFPNARHIFCWREPAAVGRSMARRVNGMPEEGTVGYPSGWYGDIFLAGYQDIEGDLERRHRWMAEQLTEMGHRAAARLGNRCFVSQHEYLLERPHLHLEKIADFLGIVLPDHMAGIIERGVIRS